MFGRKQQQQQQQQVKGKAGKTLEQLAKETGKDYSKRGCDIRKYHPISNGWGKGGK